MEIKNKLSLKEKRIFTVLVLVLAAAFTVFVCFAVGKPMVKFVSDPEKFRAWVDSHGILSRIAFIGMVTFQVVIAVVPGEPFEIGAGYAFGTVEGTLLSLVGVLIGSIVIFFVVRTVGIKAVEVFFPIEKIRSLRFLKNTKRLNLLVFLLFLVPGTPKDLISYFVGLTEIKFGYWLFVATVVRIPSIITSAAGGDALGLGKYGLAVIFLVATAIISGAGLLYYRYMTKKENEKSDKNEP